MFLQLLITGLALGVVYGLIAMGMVLIFRSVGVMNFAQGDFLMLGGFVSYTLSQSAGIPIAISLGLTALFMGLIGILFQFIAYWPLRTAQDKTIVVCTLGASIALREMCKLVWGAIPLSIDPIIPGAVKIGGASIQCQYLVVLVISAILMTFVYILLEKTFIGNVMQATAQDQYTASLMGIPVILAISLTFSVSILITGVGGVLLAPIFILTNTMGMNAGVKAFAAIVIGGFGSVQGAIIGGLIVGLVEIFGGMFVSTTYQDLIVFMVLIVMLIFRPQGIFGGKISEKV